MRWLWYIAQALFIGWFAFAYWQKHPQSSPTELLIMFLMWVALCAFLTACITQLWDWTIRRLRGLRRHDRETSGESLSLTGARSSAPETPKHLDRIRIGK